MSAVLEPAQFHPDFMLPENLRSIFCEVVDNHEAETRLLFKVLNENQGVVPPTAKNEAIVIKGFLQGKAQDATKVISVQFDQNMISLASRETVLGLLNEACQTQRRYYIQTLDALKARVTEEERVYGNIARSAFICRQAELALESQVMESFVSGIKKRIPVPV